MNLSTAFNLFIDEKMIAGRYKSTIETYEMIINNIFIKDIGDIEVQDLTYQVLTKFIIGLRNKELSPNTINSYWRHIKAFIKFMFLNEFMEHDITSKMPTMRGYKTLKDIYLDDEIQLIFSSITGNSRTAVQKRAIFCLLLDTGMRQGEICRIRVDDINLKHRYINVRGDKSHEDRRVPICIATVKIINKYLQVRAIPYNARDENMLFVNDKYAEINGKTIESYIKTHVKKQGITKGNTHLFRHTNLTRRCLESKDAFMVQQLAGHSDLNTTKKYYQYASSYQIAKVKFMPIDQLLASIRM